MCTKFDKVIVRKAIVRGYRSQARSDKGEGAGGEGGEGGGGEGSTRKLLQLRHLQPPPRLILMHP